MRHGLSRPASADPNSAAAILELAQAIAADDPRLHAGALMFAAAHIDIQRVRAAQRPLHAAIFANFAHCKEAVRRLGATDYYERLARRREKLAIARLEQAICENEPKLLCENEPNPIPSPSAPSTALRAVPLPRVAGEDSALPLVRRLSSPAEREARSGGGEPPERAQRASGGGGGV